MILFPGAGEATVGEQYAGEPPIPSTLPYAYYASLVTSEYQISAKMLAWLDSNLSLYNDIIVCMQQFAIALDVNQAIGLQLDLLGAIIGQGRIVGFQPSDGVSAVLDDDTYRLLLQCRIKNNHWDGKLDSLIDIWNSLFPGGTLIVNDHQDMTVDLYVAGSFSSIIQDLILNGYIIPRPQAVKYTITLAVLPMFGFDRSDDYVAGFDLGHMIA